MEPTFSQILNKLQQICSKQEKCRAEIMDYLVRKGIPSALHQPVLDQLTAERFIDEERYARAAVRDKFMLNHWGKQKIRRFLETKQISGELIEDAIGTLDESDYRKMIEDELHKKVTALSDSTPGLKAMKILQFAASRGYEEEMVREICNITGLESLL